MPGSQNRSLIAVGEGGTILHTSDGGASWKAQASGTSQYLSSVTFADANSGWAVGEGGTILHTSDGGASWKAQASGASLSLTTVTFANANSGWAVGLGGTILHTSDGGASWKEQASGTSQHLRSVRFADPKSGWAVEEGGTILHTSDGGASWGASWKPQSGASQYLNSVTFADANSGWAVGWRGTILHTSDGGAGWNVQASGTSQSLNDVTFVDANSGWAVGLGGTILHTSDGGASWKAQASGTSQYLSSVAFADANSGWAVGEEGTILHTSDGGASWKAQANGTSQELGSVTFADANSGWAVGLGGTILHTFDGGESWRAQASGTSQNLNDVTFADANSGWAVGSGGMILHTSNAGASWKAQANGTSQELSSVTFADANSGWAVGEEGTILHTSDGGASWTAQASGTSLRLNSVMFADTNAGWALGSATILHTSDGGASWKAQASGTNEYLNSVMFADANSGWAVGLATILHTSDGGAIWKAQASGTNQHLTSVTFAGANSGWAVGSEGTILHTSNAGASWKAQASGTSQHLTSVAFAGANSGWTLGFGGTILHTSDGGARWQRQDAFRYRRWPAPWLFLVVAGAIPLLIWAAIPTKIVNRTSIDELVSSDSPVTNLNDDRLGQRALVERLSRFLRNPNTSPPLVISLQARWGMGKSSVMRMLESSLKENRAAVTVWFNAWHHQKEDQLLAYLLETIQKEAVPPWLTPVGLSFRFDLLRVRLFSGIDRLAVMLVAIVFLTLRAAWPELGIFDDNGWKKWLLGIGYVAAGWVIVQTFVAFKSNPEKLTDKSGGFLVHALKELVTLPSLVGKSDVRQEFANNLKDVAEALKPQRLVIFLDDLDRCKPEQVVQILEAINFLSSVAPCVIIVGADYEKVEALVAMQFEQIALREEENKGVVDAAARIVGLRVAYARNYLKKIVNLRLNLRLPTPDDYRKLLDEQPTRRRTVGKYVQRAAVFAVLAAPVLLTLGIVHFTQKAPVIAARVARPRTEANLPTKGNAPPAPEVPTGTTPQKTTIRPEMPPAPNVSDVREDGRVIRNWLTFGLPGLIALVAMVYWFSRPRRLEEVQDAESFAQALKARGEDIFKRCESPREVRRFLNYLRLIATASGAEQTGDIEALRKEYPSKVDSDLVDLAALGQMQDAGAEGRAVRQYFEAQCDLFGLDPKTFAPRENRLPS